MSVVAAAMAASVLDDEFDKLRLYPWLTIMVPTTVASAESITEDEFERLAELVLRAKRTLSTLDEEFE